jgi:hypothetical protein
MADIVRRDIGSLREAGLTATQGDIRCVCFGHLTRLAIWNLRATWDSKCPVAGRMNVINQWFSKFGGVGAVLTALEGSYSNANGEQNWTPESVLREDDGPEDEISF